MDKLRELLTAFGEIDIDLMVYEIFKVKEMQRYLIELVQTQLRQGIDGDGVSLSSKNPFSDGFVDLFDTGRFYDTFIVVNRIGFLSVTGDNYLYGADFTDLYGEEIYQLTPDNLIKLQKKMIPYAQKYLYNYLLFNKISAV